MSFRAGDTVRHKSGETWVLACDEQSGYVMPAGWPPGEANASDCTRVEAASDMERLKMLVEVSCAASGSGRDDFGARQNVARQQLLGATLSTGMLAALAHSNEAAQRAEMARDTLNREAGKLAVQIAQERIASEPAP